MDKHSRFSISLCLLSLVWGCAVTNVAEHTKTFRLPPTRLSPDSVVLEIAQVNVPLSDDQWQETVWNELDEQSIPANQRRSLAENGIRVGLSGTKLPPEIYGQLGEPNEDAETQQTVNIVEEAMNQYRRVQLRADMRSDIVMSDPIEHLVLFEGESGTVTGKSFNNAQPQFAIFATPQGDGSAMLRVVPEFHYGTTKQKFVGDNGMFRIEPGRDRVTYEDLAITAKLTAGHTLVVTSAGPRHTVGGNLFRAADNPNEQKLLLVRLAQSQYDDLFEPDDPTD